MGERLSRDLREFDIRASLRNVDSRRARCKKNAIIFIADEIRLPFIFICYKNRVYGISYHG